MAMAQSLRRRVSYQADDNHSDGMELDSPAPTERRVLRTRASLPALSTTKSIAKSTPTGKPKVQPKPLRRHSSRVDILAERKKSSQCPTPEPVGKTGKSTPKSTSGKLQTTTLFLKDSNSTKQDIFDLSSDDGNESDTSSGSSSSWDSDAPPRPAPGSRVLNKKWASHGLYVGQDMQIQGRSTLKHRKSSQIMNKSALPLPMYKGLVIMEEERNFFLPYGVFNLTPWVIPKPPGWKALRRNVFCGNAYEIYKRNLAFTKKAHQSTVCACTKETGGCGPNCLNRIMYYECDKTNCSFSDCANRPFRDLAIRVENDTWFNDGIEIILTEDKGYGLRAVRSFNPNQIIVEYCGEIITQDECNDRLKKRYKDNESFYLMEFDNSMIIDATRGSVARFVNHSCAPNCKMEKWMVEGKPRMALFAGDAGIEVGEELTYDYNFNWFSGVSNQVCRCGARNCRGSLGKRSDVKKPSPSNDDRPNKRGISDKESKPKPKKIIRKKVVKASNARVVKQPPKAKPVPLRKTARKPVPARQSKPVKAVKATPKKQPPSKSKSVSKQQAKPKSPILARRGKSSDVLPQSQARGKRLSTTTVQKQSKRTIDEKKSTTVSLKKANSKVFKVTKVYSKKKVTNSHVVRRTLVEEQPAKALESKKQKKKADAKVVKILKPKTTATPRKNTHNKAAIEKAVDLAKLPIPRRTIKAKKVDLICARPSDDDVLAINEDDEVTATNLLSSTAKSPGKGTKTPAKRGRPLKGSSTDNAGSTPLTTTPKKRGRPRKDSLDQTPNTATPKSRRKGIPPPKDKKTIDNDDGNLDYETEVETIRKIFKKPKPPKNPLGPDGLPRRGRGRPKGSLGKKNAAIAAAAALARAKARTSELVYPCSLAGSSGGLKSINIGTFYGLTGGIRPAPIYHEMLYQRPVMPIRTPLKRAREESVTSSGTRRPDSDDTAVTEPSHTTWADIDELFGSTYDPILLPTQDGHAAKRPRLEAPVSSEEEQVIFDFTNIESATPLQPRVNNPFTTIDTPPSNKVNAAIDAMDKDIAVIESRRLAAPVFL